MSTFGPVSWPSVNDLSRHPSTEGEVKTSLMTSFLSILSLLESTQEDTASLQEALHAVHDFTNAIKAKFGPPAGHVENVELESPDDPSAHPVPTPSPVGTTTRTPTTQPLTSTRRRPPPVDRPRRSTIAPAPAVTVVDARPPPRKRRRTALEDPPRVAWTDTCGVGHLSVLRQNVITALSTLQVSRTKDRKGEVVGLTPTEQADMVAFLFNDIMGLPTLQRLQRAVRQYNTAQRSGLDNGAAQRAQQESEAPETIDAIRPILGAFARQKSGDEVGTSTFTDMHRLTDRLNTYEEFDKLRERAGHKDPQLLQDLRTALGVDQPTSAGRDWKSVVIDHVSASCNLDRDAFINMCRQGEGLDAMVKLFGRGILPLLPPNAHTRLNAWGTPKVTAFCQVIQEHVDLVQRACNVLETGIYEAVMKGHQQIGDGSSVEEGPLYDRLVGLVGHDQRRIQAGRSPGVDPNPPLTPQS